MKILRTPEDRFEKLPDFDFNVHYTTIDDLQMAYIDEGEGETVLLLHGEPSWSFLYRRMIVKLKRSGYRVVVPDLIGFGRSDKPVEASAYTYENHVHWVLSFINQLELTNINLFCQDWGGLIGLRIAAFHQELFARIVASNTFLPTGDRPAPEAFLKWQQFAKYAEHFDIGKVIQMGTVTELTEEEIAAYNAPFPDESYKVGARVFPSIVPTEKDDPQAQINREAWQLLSGFSKPFLTAFGDSDPITAGAEKVIQKLVPGCKGFYHPIISGGGHFIQEDKPDMLATIIHNFIKNTPQG